jgi:hypothetical protein
MKFKKFISDWVWQLPQNLCGVLYKTFIMNSIIKPVNEDNKEYLCYLTRGKGGVTLGKYIFVSQDYKDLTYVIKHESGHVKQSKILGPLYLLVIGLPSVIHAALHHYVCKNPDYYHFYTERWANKLGGVAFL